MEQNSESRQDTRTILVNRIKAEQQVAQKAIDWVSLHLQAESVDKVRDDILSSGVKMRHINRALHCQPAAAIFGESQVGKSYLVSNLLKNTSDVFNVKNPGDGEVNFLSDLNPMGGGAESTSLITRFTVRASSSPNPSFPIKAVIFTPTDLVLTIADSYYSDIKNHIFLTPDRLKEAVEAIIAKYADMNHAQDFLNEVDIYEMEAYLNPSRFPIAGHWLRTLGECGYFHRLAKVIGNVAPGAWKDVFSILWNNNPILTDIFSRLVRLLSDLDFSQEVYISIDPLRNSTGTVLSVDRIKEFFGVTADEKGNAIEVAKVPDMQVWTPGGVKRVLKSEFTSVAAEIVLEVPEDVASEKPFLNNLDILDFPGARTRENTDEKDITDDKACNMVLRGRVAYLFNKYSRSYLISSLLFCFHPQQSNVKTLAELLNGWISDMVGDTPQARQEFLSGMDVPPLFIVGTKFNIDLVRNAKTEKEGESEEKLLSTATDRWENRFNKFLLDILDGRAPESWYNNWTPGATFDNLYMLRDYDYSTQIFEGYAETHTETGVRPEYNEFLERLRATFLNHSAVKAHFRNPQEAWQRSATPGQDGSEYIIENLVAASQKVVQRRDMRFEQLVAANFSTIFNSLFNYYHPDNGDAQIQASLRDAGRISFIFDTLFSSKPQFFADFISKMLVAEDKLHDKVLDVAADDSLRKKTDIPPLIAIRERAGVDAALTDEQNLERLMRAYHTTDISQMEAYLERFGYSIDDVLHPGDTQNLAQVLVVELEKLWFERYLNPANLKDFTAYGLTTSDLEAITGALKALYSSKLDLRSTIIGRLRKYVTTPDKLDEMAEMIADIVAETFNKFVNSFGTAFFPEELWSSIAATAQKGNIDIPTEHTDPDTCVFNENQALEYMAEVCTTFEHIDEVMNDISSHRDKLGYFSNLRHFSEWISNMKSGFVASCDIPKYDIQLNNSLRHLIVEQFDSHPEFARLYDSYPQIAQSLQDMKEVIKATE